MKSSTSATASKKIKISHAAAADDDDEEEEENMEKFYALIKSIREARDRLIVNNNSSSSAEILNKDDAAAADGDQSETKKRKVEEDQIQKQVVVRSPSLQREDFLEEADYKVNKLSTVRFGSTSQRKQGSDIANTDKKEEVKEELDLNLSL